MKIAIHQNSDIFDHSTMWDKVWIEYCRDNRIDYEVVNCFDNNILEILKRFDVLLWHFSHYSLQEMMFARTILNSAKKIGLRVFPDFSTSWHFDDKIAETYLLNTIKAPIPKSWVFYSKNSAFDFFQSFSDYPLVAKLKCGSGSSNVKLIKDKYHAKKYIRKMFKKGYKTAPSIVFKAKSNIMSSADMKTIINRFKRIPDFIQSFTSAKLLPNEKGYVFFQEFVPNDGYDLKVIVVGDKLSFLARDVRKGDFRASGGGTIKYNHKLITMEIRNTAFRISRELKFQCMSYDFVIDNRNNTPRIVEISYGFSHIAQIGLGGYWKESGEWIDEPLNAPTEILQNLVEE